MRRSDAERLLDFLGEIDDGRDHGLVRAFQCGAAEAVRVLYRAKRKGRELPSSDDPVVQIAARVAALRRLAAGADADRTLGIELEIIMLDAWSPGWYKEQTEAIPPETEPLRAVPALALPQ